MQHSTGEFTAHDKAKLFWQSWLPDTPPRVNVIVVHGLGEHSGRYGTLIDTLIPLGYAVHAFDLRGHGRSPGRRAYVKHFSNFTRDLHVFVENLRQRYPAIPVYLFGHSMGGTIAAAYVIERPENITGLILSSPSITVLPDMASPFLLSMGKLLSAVVPGAGIKSIEAAAISHDGRVVEDYMRDPLVLHAKFTARLGWELITAMRRITEQSGSIKLPILITHGTADRLTNPEGSQLLYRQCSSPDKTLMLYPDWFHETIHEPEKEKVLQDISEWLGKRSRNTINY